jgi:uncharacterized membrane protein
MSCKARFSFGKEGQEVKYYLKMAMNMVIVTLLPPLITMVMMVIIII